MNFSKNVLFIFSYFMTVFYIIVPNNHKWSHLGYCESHFFYNLAINWLLKIHISVNKKLIFQEQENIYCCSPPYCFPCVSSIFFRAIRATFRSPVGLKFLKQVSYTLPEVHVSAGLTRATKQVRPLSNRNINKICN